MLTTLIRRLLEAPSDEAGAVLVLFAAFMPVAILFAALVVILGSASEHHQHLQLQADAGVLAAAQAFQYPCSASVNESIRSSLRQYDGSNAGSYNKQVGETESHKPAIHERVNKKTYYEQSSPVVKLTETGLPLILKAFDVPYINAHARVSILQESKGSGVSPMAVADAAPIAARAYFVNEDKGNEVITSVLLAKQGSSNGQDIWSNTLAPVSLAISKTNSTTAHIGVVIALSGKTNDTTCGHEFVQCFDQGSTGPLLHIAGYSNEGTGSLTAPLAREATLSSPAPNTCTDGYFSNSSSNCTFTVSAKIDYGSTNAKGVTVTAKGAALAFNATSGLWTGTVTLANGSGSNEIPVVVKCAKATGSACPTASTEATIQDVHRIYAASKEHSGTIASASIAEVGGLPSDANSFQVCEAQDGNSCTHKLVVMVNVSGSLANAQQFSDPIYVMRLGSSQADGVACPPNSGPSASNYRESLAKGCVGKYAINTSDPNCTANTEPFDCLGVFRQGMEKRIQTEPPPGTRPYCPNNWKNNNGNGVPILPKDDSRIVQVFIEPYGALNANGEPLTSSGEIPIQNFATFYVTGYDGDSCSSDPSAGKAEVFGHFIKYVTVSGEGSEEQKCVQNAIGTCVAVLTQ